MYADGPDGVENKHDDDAAAAHQEFEDIAKARVTAFSFVA